MARMKTGQLTTEFPAVWRVTEGQGGTEGAFERMLVWPTLAKQPSHTAKEEYHPQLMQAAQGGGGCD